MRRILILIAVIAVAATPVVASAAPSWFPIVPCGVQGTGGNPVPCSPCHLFQGVKNVTDLILFGITGPIAAFMVTLAGGMMLLGGASPSQYSRGKEILTNTLSGVTVILLAWVATNFLIKSIGTGSPANAWYQFTCPAFLSSIENKELELPANVIVGPPPQIFKPLAVPEGFDAAAKAVLAARYNVPPVAKNSPALERLITCLYNDPMVAALTGPRPANGGVQTGNNFTYDNKYDACNYTRGTPIIGSSCEHGNPSCHYGGRTGKDGAEAVDLNGLLKRVPSPTQFDKDGKPVMIEASDERLFCELYRILSSGTCPDFKYLDLHKKHSHISTKACDVDGTGAGTTYNKDACKSLLKIPDGAQPATAPSVDGEDGSSEE